VVTTPLLEPSPSTAVTALQALRQADRAVRAGGLGAVVWRTGFDALDRQLDGGLRAGALCLLAGGQGTGKTTMALQLARNVAAAGREVVYVCYEHTPNELVEKLMVLECSLAAGAAAPSQEEFRRALCGSTGGLDDAVAHLPGAAPGLAMLQRYGDRLHLVPARGDVTGIAEIRAAAGAGGAPALLVVDYAQKIHVAGVADEDVRMSRVATALKDLALELACPVLAVSAVDREGLEAKRIRPRHLKGSVTLAYEADTVLVLQLKYDVVARQHLVYDLARAEEHHRWLVCMIEKNRYGEDGMAVEFRKRLSHAHLEPAGRIVEEQLVDERLRLND
jgi:replicative DNA helicase